MKFKSFEGNPKKPAAVVMERELVQGETEAQSFELLFKPVEIIVGGQMFEVSACARTAGDRNDVKKMVEAIDTESPWSFATSEQLQCFTERNSHLISKRRLIALGDIVPIKRAAEVVVEYDGEIRTATYYPDFGLNDDMDILVARPVS
jgi:hypothetical protein